MASPCIRDGDYVCISGGGVRRIVEVRKGVRVRLGRAGTALTHSLVGAPYGGVVELQHHTHHLVPTDAYPDLDLAEVIAAMTREDDDEDEGGEGEDNNTTDVVGTDEKRSGTTGNNNNNDDDDDDDEANVARDNRTLHDDNSSQRLSNAEVAVIRRERGLGALLTQLRANSTTFAHKTRYAQEKYLRKKATKYATLYKLERVYADNLAETMVPTIAPSETDDAHADTSSSSSSPLRLRADTLALMLHHSNTHARSRIVLYDMTNGVLPACLLARLGAHGRLFHVLDKPSQPNTQTAMRVMQLSRVKERWRAIPRNEGLQTGLAPTAVGGGDHGDNGKKTDDANVAATTTTTTGDVTHDASHVRRRSVTVSQWMPGSDARATLLAQPADSLIVAVADDPCAVLRSLFDFVALCGHIVVYCPYLCELTSAFAWLRERCVHVRLSETWYRHHQVLPRRTHPTVHMSTAGGYLLTALKVEQRRGVGGAPPHNAEGLPTHKRARNDDDDDDGGEGRRACTTSARDADDNRDDAVSA